MKQYYAQEQSLFSRVFFSFLVVLIMTTCVRTSNNNLDVATVDAFSFFPQIVCSSPTQKYNNDVVNNIVPNKWIDYNNNYFLVQISSPLSSSFSNGRRIRRTRKSVCYCLDQKREGDDAPHNIDDEDDDEYAVINGDDVSYEKSKKIRYRARVAYDGTGYQGWQAQHNFQVPSSANDHNNNKKNKHNTIRTVQGEIQVVLSQRFQRDVSVVGAGRTDAGVHARGQAIHFDLYPHEINPPIDSNNNNNNNNILEEFEKDGDDDERSDSFCESLQKSINSMSRRDVRIWNLEPAPIYPNLPRYPYWHVIQHAKSKLYTYRFCTSRSINPNHRHFRVHFYDLTNNSNTDGIIDPTTTTLDNNDTGSNGANIVHYGQTPLQVERMQQILSTFVGTKEFVAFAGKIERNERKSGKKRTTIRTVYDIQLIDEGNSNYRVDIYLKGALYKMVRNIVGTAFDVYRGELSLQSLQTLLQIQDVDDDDNITLSRKSNNSKPAPPEGLTLEKVFYEDDINF